MIKNDEKINDQDGREVKKTEKTVVRSNFISPENIKTVQEGMRQTVTDGSASILKNIHVEGRIKRLWLIFFGKKDP
jgi:cell division protein FtsI/penicillin-binding protein 2